MICFLPWGAILTKFIQDHVNKYLGCIGHMLGGHVSKVNKMPSEELVVPWRRQTCKELSILDILPVSQYTSLDIGWEVERKQLHRDSLERLNRSLQDEQGGKEHSREMEALKNNGMFGELT